MSTSNLVSLDWRNAPSTADIIERICRLFSDLDQRNEVNLCLSSSTAKGAVSLVAQDDGTAMLRRHNNRVSRTVSSRFDTLLRMFRALGTISLAS